LPTEAEWEFAARGGRERKGYTYSGSHTIGEVAWYEGNATGQATTTGQVVNGAQLRGSRSGDELGIYNDSQNELGLYDMSGNVWEYCSDWWDSYNAEAQFNPKGPAGGTYRVIRGGAWNTAAATCRTTYRGQADHLSTNVGKAIGFRLAHPFDYVAEFESNMVNVPGGSFTIGDADITGATPHTVTISPFRIGKFEVTQAQWLAIVGVSVSATAYNEGANLPVHDISWNDAQRFIDSLYAKTGKRYRLPTEAEWEYAARGGNTYAGNAYSGSNVLGNVGWYDGNSEGRVHLVGTKTANALGLYDMSGNVWEWCNDWWAATYNGGLTSAENNPEGPALGTRKVMRGGSWDSESTTCRVANRSNGGINEYFSYAVGFRLVLDPISELEGNMVSIPAGNFTMGGAYNGYNAGTSHTVRLSAYKIGRYEVTQAQWQAVMKMGAWPGTAPNTTYGVGHDYPIYYVSIAQTKVFIDALNLKTGLNYRLPTESEWEYAARGGAQSKTYPYSGSPTLNHVAWNSTNVTTNPRNHPVGTIADQMINEYHSWLSAEERIAPHPLVTKGANELGLFDMSGNVWEWVSDGWAAYPSGTVDNPTGAVSTNRTIRGGSNNETGDSHRVNYRYGAYAETNSTWNVGFRLVIPQ
jgi:formylglycine-generating enzyme required for sulfatase activity